MHVPLADRQRIGVRFPVAFGESAQRFGPRYIEVQQPAGAAGADYYVHAVHVACWYS